jgi:hypothetical protein
MTTLTGDRAPSAVARGIRILLKPPRRVHRRRSATRARWRQRLAGHALLVLPRGWSCYRAGGNICYADTRVDQPRARHPRRRPLRGGESRPTRRPR